MLKRILRISTKFDSSTYSCFDVIGCLFNLRETDVLVLQLLSMKNGKTIAEIAHKLKKDRSTIHRSLEKLLSSHLCFKERKSGKTRGFADYYFRLPEHEILRVTEKNLDACYSKIKKMLHSIENKKM